MAEPKKKLSKSRTGSRRNQIKLKLANINYCEKCHEPKLRHVVCKNCGTYRGKKVFEFDKKSKLDTEENKSE